MDAHALAVLELGRVLELVAGHASSEPGRRRVLDLRPLATRAAAALELERVGEAARLLEPDAGFPFPDVYDLELALGELAVEGSVLEARPLLELGRTLRDARRVRKFLLRRDDLPQLQGQALTIVEQRLLEDRVLASFEDDGEIADSASPDLRRLREDLRARRQDIKTRLERVLRGLPRNVLTPDPNVTLREGRYVIPVLREAKSVLKGIIHDESASGLTIYVEPDAVIPLNNALRETELAVRREEQRILRQLTHLLRPLAVELGIAHGFLVDLDTLLARARFRASLGAGVFTFADDDRIDLRGARHPLLVASLAGAGRPVVPLDLELEPGERTLLVTGPNTGGKTVLLKTVGIAALLAQSGVPPAVSDGSRLPFFGSIFADIGDEQSIESSLSTFSSHLRTIVATLQRADVASLVLLDEVGVGTDPHEGVALASAVLESLNARGARTLGTTHYGELKKLAASVPGMINGSLDFDADRIQPRYRFRKGLPGRSYGLVIARALGLDGPTIARAEELLDRGHVEVQRLTEELGRHAEELDRRAEAMRAERDAAERRLAETERRLQEKEAHLERDYQEQLERLVQRQRDLLRDVRERLKRLGEAERQRELLEELRRELHDSGETLAAARRASARPAPAFAVGEAVELSALGVRGDVVEVLPARGEVVVRAGGKRLTVPAGELARAAPAPGRGSVTYAGAAAGETADEIDVRGLSAHEVSLPVERAIDRAASAGLPSLRIIHGKGEGVLRDRVQSLLTADARVRSFRGGLWHEGGSGVTVAELG